MIAIITYLNIKNMNAFIMMGTIAIYNHASSTESPVLINVDHLPNTPACAIANKLHIDFSNNLTVHHCIVCHNDETGAIAVDSMKTKNKNPRLTSTYHSDP